MYTGHMLWRGLPTVPAFMSGTICPPYAKNPSFRAGTVGTQGTVGTREHREQPCWDAGPAPQHLRVFAWRTIHLVRCARVIPVESPPWSTFSRTALMAVAARVPRDVHASSQPSGGPDRPIHRYARRSYSSCVGGSSRCSSSFHGRTGSSAASGVLDGLSVGGVGWLSLNF